MKILKSLALVVALGAASTSMAQARTITSDVGGSIKRFQQQFKIAAQQNQPFRIKGTCLSACTIFLGLPNVCVYPNAVLGFHGAWPKVANAAQQRRADMVMGQYLPSVLKELYDTKWRHHGANSFERLSGRLISIIDHH